MSETTTQPTLRDTFDRMIGLLDGLPDVTKTKPTTKRVVTPLIGQAQTFIVQTYRQREIGDTVFIEYVGAEGSIRFVVPPEVADTIARQRDGLTTVARRRGAQQAVETRKERGIAPGFLKKKGTKR